MATYDPGLTPGECEVLRLHYESLSLSPSTLRAYGGGWKVFASWCAANGRTNAPDVAVLADCMASLASSRSLSGLRGIACAVAYHWYKQDGYIAQLARLHHLFRGIQESHDHLPRKAAGFGVDDIQKIIATCDASRLLGVRDKAMILLGFAGAFRRSELVAINAEHLTWTPDGVSVFVPRSKEDQDGRGATVRIARGNHHETCPVTALRAWMTRAGIQEGPIFVQLTKAERKGARLSDKAVARAVIGHASAAGLTCPEGQRISSHSLRAGFVTTAYKGGALDEEIMEHTRHKTNASMRGYVRRDKLNTDVSSRIGL